jgi:hypothetical protein
MPTTTTTLVRSVVSDAAVDQVLTLAGQPLSTQEIAARLADEAKVDLDVVPMTRLRRSLERLERDGRIIGSGGPKRAELMGWPVVDGRDVQWATITVAERIRDEHRSNVERIVAEQNERAMLLRDLHGLCDHDARVNLNIVGIVRRLSNDVTYRDPNGGATTWSLDELRTVVWFAEEAARER